MASSPLPARRLDVRGYCAITAGSCVQPEAPPNYRYLYAVTQLDPEHIPVMPKPERFFDRRSAGRLLGDVLAGRAGENPIVVGMARGGIPVAGEVAKRLAAPLDLVVVRKVGAPFQPELAIGAIAEGGARDIDSSDAHRLGLSRGEVETAVAREREELAGRVARYRSEFPRLDVTQRKVILVDDGYATGHTAVAAADSLHAAGALRITLAVPVCPMEAAKAEPKPPIDEFICLAPRPMVAVGQWYEHFDQITDSQVLEVMSAARQLSGNQTHHSELLITDGQQTELPADLTLPRDPRGLVIFVHGSGSGRRSPRNQLVARLLNSDGFATLLFDLLTDEEASVRRNVFDVRKLANRLHLAADTMREVPGAQDLPLGLFGASTGAAAALVAAADPDTRIRAVVSRGGRPDLAGQSLALVQAPTLLIVGSEDPDTVALNRAAMNSMNCQVAMSVVPGAGHLFEGPGQLEDVAAMATDWFERHLPSPS